MATVHMICGPVGVGKTTYGRALARERRAVHVVIDEWMATLFMMDAPPTSALAWALARVERCEAQIAPLIHQLAGLDVDAVVELGFYTRDQRERFRASTAGLTVVVHHLVAAREVRRLRVRARNLGGATLTIAVDDAVFDWAEGYYQPLDPDELRGAVVVAT